MSDVLFDFPNLSIALKEYGDFLVTEYKGNLEKNGHRATGQLISSIYSVINIGQNSASVELHLADYYKYLEKERLKGSLPPVNKILEWIQVKPILPRPDENGKLPTEEQLAWAIAKNMEKEGAPTRDGMPVEPTKDLGEAIGTTDEFFWGKIEEALVEDLESMFNSSISILMA